MAIGEGLMTTGVKRGEVHFSRDCVQYFQAPWTIPSKESGHRIEEDFELQGRVTAAYFRGPGAESICGPKHGLLKA